MSNLNGTISSNMDELLSLTQVSELLHVHPNTLRRWDREHILPSIRFGQRKDRHYRLHDVNAFLGKSRGEHQSETETAVNSNVQRDLYKKKFDVQMQRFSQIESLVDSLFTQIEQKSIGQIICDQLKNAVQANTCLLYLPTKDETQLHLLSFSGCKERSVKKWREISLQDSLPVADALRTKRPIILENESDYVVQYPELVKAQLHKGVHSHAIFPLLLKEKVIGVLALQFTSVFKLTVEDMFFLTLLLKHCSMALEKARLYEQESTNSVYTDRLKKMVRRMNTSAVRFLVPKTTDELFPIIAEEMRELLGAKHSTILLMQNGTLKRVFATSPVIARTQVKRNGRTYKAFYQSEPFTAVVKGPEDIHPDQYALKVKQLVFIPLSYNEERLGVMNVYLPEETVFNSEELHLLKFFGSLVSLCIRKSQMADETEHSLRLRDLFISFASHELKTPLTVISLYVQLLQKKIHAQVLPDKKIGTILGTEVTRLTNLINELMQVSQIRSGQFHYDLKKINLIPTLTKAQSDFSIVHTQRTLQLLNSVGPTAYIQGDADKVLQVWTNILNNAAKFSPESKPVTIAVDKVDDCYSITISDQGKGIKKKHLANIFSDFYKGDSKKEGMGLGLFIVKKIVTRHGGEISIESSKKGTTVKIGLPAL